LNNFRIQAGKGLLVYGNSLYIWPLKDFILRIMKIIRYTLFSLLLTCSAMANSQVLINEFMAANTSTITDEFGGYPDWIEIKNLTAEPVDIGGWYITDSIPDLAKHMIAVTQPDSTTIPANGFLVLWADSKKSQGVRHVDFKLGKDGEQIAISKLVGGKLTIIDSVTFKGQVSDLSMGRERGTNKWIYMNQPTPGSANLPLGVIAREEGGNIRVWPNPCNGVFNISSPATGITTIRVIDIQGREIYLHSLTSDELKSGKQIELENEPAGIYRVLVISDAGTSGVNLVLQ
jgi:hypothetical protein